VRISRDEIHRITTRRQEQSPRRGGGKAGGFGGTRRGEETRFPNSRARATKRGRKNARLLLSLFLFLFFFFFLPTSWSQRRDTYSYLLARNISCREDVYARTAPPDSRRNCVPLPRGDSAASPARQFPVSSFDAAFLSLPPLSLSSFLSPGRRFPSRAHLQNPGKKRGAEGSAAALPTESRGLPPPPPSPRRNRNDLRATWTPRRRKPRAKGDFSRGAAETPAGRACRRANRGVSVAARRERSKGRQPSESPTDNHANQSCEISRAL